MSDTRERKRRPHWPAAVAVVAGGALVAGWAVRKPVAERLIDQALRARGVPVRYTIADLGLGRQRLTHVALGDPAHPDLVADWIETETGIGPSGPTLAGVRMGHVRLRARIVDGHVSFGTLDRLLPPPSGKPFALPAIDAAVADARVWLDTPAGAIELKLSGSGRLDSGFTGHLAAVSPGLDLGRCHTGDVETVLAIRTTRGAPTLAGPIRVAAARCGTARLQGFGAEVVANLSPALDRWRGTARLSLARASQGAAGVRDVVATLGFDGRAAATAGVIDGQTGAFALPDARGAGLALAGRWRLTKDGVGFAGQGSGRTIALADRAAASLDALPGRWQGTPLAPLASRLVRALDAAGRGFDANVALSAAAGPAGPHVAVSQGAARARSGAQATLGGQGVAYDGQRLQVGGARLAIGGGGMPDAAIRLRQTGTTIVGDAAIAPYLAGDARLAFAAVHGVVAGGAARVTGAATLSGPLAGGRIDDLAVPFDLRWDGSLALNPACTPLSLRRLALAGLVLGPTALRLCPAAGALVRTGPAGLSVAARLAPATLAGRLGGSALTVATAGGRLDAQGFALGSVAVRIGEAERATRIAAEQLAGRYAAGGVSGTVAGLGGRIGTVPLRLSGGAGAWRFADGRLALDGALQVGDTAPVARFRTLGVQDVAFTLAGNRIAATGTLVEPTRARKVADVAIEHRLDSGTGTARLQVPALAFDPRFQPDLLTPLTLGVVADVRGTVNGTARIDWTPDGVTSTGDVHTADTDLAAALGPVTGIAARIHFTDLLALESAPGQVATVRTINPGIPVENGTIRFQTLAGARIRIEEGDWPFAGGTLRLEPTLLDFSQAAERRMTFRVSGIAADQFLQQFAFKNLDATGVFDGVLPMAFDEAGGRIEGGSLAVRAGGGTLAYVGDLSQKDLGTWGNIAFQALKSLRYKSLAIAMNGPLAGEMVTDVRFAGVSQGQGAKSNFVIRRLQALPIVFNIRITAPFRGLLDSAQSFYDPQRLVARNLPALLDAQDKAAAPAAAIPVQPPASRIVP